MAVLLDESLVGLPTGVTATVAAGLYVIGVPYFTGTHIPECDLLAPSLADPAIARALGLS